MEPNRDILLLRVYVFFLFRWCVWYWEVDLDSCRIPTSRIVLLLLRWIWSSGEGEIPDCNDRKICQRKWTILRKMVKRNLILRVSSREDFFGFYRSFLNFCTWCVVALRKLKGPMFVPVIFSYDKLNKTISRFGTSSFPLFCFLVVTSTHSRFII